MKFVWVTFATPLFDEMVELRNAVLRKPLGLEFYPEDIESEWDSFHLGAYSETGVLLGCMVMKPLTDVEVKMRQVAVSPGMQGRGVGRQMVYFVENWAEQEGFSRIVLHARKEALSFYDKLDYHKEGAQFTEVGIPHFKMFKDIPLTR